MNLLPDPVYSLCVCLFVGLFVCYNACRCLALWRQTAARRRSTWTTLGAGWRMLMLARIILRWWFNMRLCLICRRVPKWKEDYVDQQIIFIVYTEQWRLTAPKLPYFTDKWILLIAWGQIMFYEDRFGPYEILICHKSEVFNRIQFPQYSECVQSMVQYSKTDVLYGLLRGNSWIKK